MNGCRGQPRAAKPRQRGQDAGAGVPRGMVRVDEYPNLRLLRWNLKAPYVTRRDAFSLYERNWRLVDHAAAPAPERAFIDDLAREFGQGLINA